jgi:AcrR family transcriptional regulator
MGRPSNKEQRREEILVAYEKCVARFGVEGATLERIAEEAGLARALLRHHVGNREDLLNALLARFFKASDSVMAYLIKKLPEEQRIFVLADWLFDPDYTDPHLVLVTESLIAASLERPKLAQQMKDWLARFVDLFTQEIKTTFPHEDDETCAIVAMGFTAIYFNIDSLSPLGEVDHFRYLSKQAALRLLKTLEA